MITKAFLTEQIAQLTAEKDQHLASANTAMANANATQGAILICQRFLAQLEKAPSQPEGLKPCQPSS